MSASRSADSRTTDVDAARRSEREFVRHAGHALRGSLTICRGHLDLIEDDPEERRATIALVTGELSRMGRLIEDLELLAEAEQPEFLRSEPIDVTLFAHELTAEASTLAERDWRLDAAADGTMLADRERLAQAVMKLAENAVQHTRAADAIGIGASVSEDEVRLWVRDTGSGVSASDQARIFDRFRRGTGASSRHRGIGLGLAVVEAIAGAHGGHVELESRLGEGSTFTVVLPSKVPGDGADA